MKISIITINYNNLDGLKKTMTSVLEQTYANVEYIIIDGGSTDGSKRYIESCQQDLAYWVSESDRGIYNAMNKGIAQATGEYLLFLNSGDWLAGVKVLDLISKNLGNCGILYGNLIKVYANGSEKVDKGPESSQLTLFHFFVRHHQSSFSFYKT
ncbi:glycosyltransferase [Gelidibacter algens]|uniref:glycosyltransferase n=1 Tax=Gelidibacter algens TaxID=49280 RepID=UPI0009FFAD74|nr:glycosyltransferase [Gelidibacter algens]